nr:Chain B, MYOSIN VA VARIANT [Homo sapiens]
GSHMSQKEAIQPKDDKNTMTDSTILLE